MNQEQAAKVGKWIRRARKARRWSQAELAVQTGVSDETVSKLETGKQGKRGPQLGTIAAVEKAFEVPPGTIDRVAAGEDVPVTSASGADDADVLMLIGGLRDSLDRLEQRLAKQDRRIDDLERRADDQGR